MTTANIGDGFAREWQKKKKGTFPSTSVRAEIYEVEKGETCHQGKDL
jgi:hypothetical protein